MIITYTNLKTGVVQDLQIADARCDEILDRCAAMMKPNPVELQRWHAMMAKREAGLYDGAPPAKKRSR